MTMQTVLASNVSGSVTREPALPGRRKSPPWWSLCSQAPYLCHITIFTHTNIIIQLLVGHKLIFVHTQYGWLWIWMFVDDCKFPRCQRQPNTILLVLLSRICHKHPNEIPAIPHVSLLTKWKTISNSGLVSFDSVYILLNKWNRSDTPCFFAY